MITQVRERALFLMERPTARAAMCRGLPTLIDGQGYRMVEASDNPQKLGYDLRKVGLTPALSEQQRADLKSAAENGQRLWTGASGVSTGVPVVDADSCIIAGDPGNLSTVGQPEQRHGRWEPLG